MWQLIIQSDAMSKGVMLLLLGMSIASWTIFLYKLIFVRIKKQQLKRALHMVMKADSFERFIQESTLLQGTLPGYFLARCLQVLESLMRSQKYGESPSLCVRDNAY